MCIDLCAVDYLTNMERQVVEGVRGERFELVVNLLDLDSRRRIRLRLQVPQDSLDVPTLTDIHPGTEAMEREAFDMFGLNFLDHPDLTRILLPEEWEGHPLRKDYSIGRIPVQFKAPQGR
jgi:NADH-quinone oxidoreductase subunit C